MNGSAVILAHIPTNNGCLHAWGARFRALMERYQHIVRFSLSGHTHSESFSIIKGINDNKNIGINYVAGSVTTFTDDNPGFTVLELDAEYLVPLNYK